MVLWCAGCLMALPPGGQAVSQCLNQHATRTRRFVKSLGKLSQSALAMFLGPVGQTALLLCGCLQSAALSAGPVCNQQCKSAKWIAVETANFRILSFGTRGVDQETANTCETMRGKLARQWLGEAAGADWNPKCDIVLHPNDDAYLREVGVGGRNTVASSLVDRKQGRVAARRIDVRGTQPRWQSTALGHELTHVVLADRFAAAPLPRWVDEGIAIMADPVDKQARHRQELTNAMATRAQFRVLELITLADYPAAQRWGTFYGQSASLVQYLVDQAGPERFLHFVQLSLDLGYEQGLLQVYNFGVAELERKWHAHAATPAETADAKPALRVPANTPSVSAPAVIRPVSLLIP